MSEPTSALPSCTLVVASRNDGKVREIRELLAGLPVRILCLTDFPDLPEVAEPHDTFAANAADKALAVAKATGYLALADDSGLCVDALDGAPGVRSARVAASDPERIAWLLAKLAGVPRPRRTARFVCAAVLAKPDGEIHTSEGVTEGFITEAPAGDNGFGYDPIFYTPQFDRTFAELTSHEKNSISHRGKALRQVRETVARLIAERESLA